MPRLEDEFHSELLSLYEKAKGLDYLSNYFKQMLDRYGGFKTAKRLLAESKPQQGLYSLWELDALDISLEATVLKDRFRPLFTSEELDEAMSRLADLGHEEA